MFDEEPDGDLHGECAAEIHRLNVEYEVMRRALVGAVAVIQTWHNMGAGKDASTLWDIYWRNAPEIKPIRAALASAHNQTPKDQP